MFELFAIGILLVILIVGVASLYWHERQKKFLLTTVTTDQNTKNKAAEVMKKMGLEGQVAVGVTIFDVFYNGLKIDTYVLRGIDHLHHGQSFDNLGELISFMKESIVQDKDGTAFRQIVHKYKGYTGEEYAFESLRESGAHVVVPESGTYPGADAFVNGTPMNVKITDNPAYIHAHFREYPNVPVITNSEMHHAFADDPNVTIMDDISAQKMFNVTEDSLDGMIDMGDLIDKIPLVTLTVATIKNVKHVWNGEKDIRTAGEHIVCDTAAVGIGGGAGAKIGLAIGLALVPATGGTSALVIPAISSVVGTILGVLSGKSIVNWFKERHLREAIEQLKVNASNYYEAFTNSAHEIMIKVAAPITTKVELCNNTLKNGRWWILRALFPTLQEKFYNMSIEQLEKEKQNIRSYYKELLTLMRKKKAEEAGLLLYAQGVGVLAEDRALCKCYNAVEQAVKKVEQEKNKLKYA